MYRCILLNFMKKVTANLFYFFYKDNVFVLLHHFRKKTQKTPKREIEKAMSERADYLSRKERKQYEDLERI